MQREPILKRKFVRSATFLGAVLVHLILFLLLATVVVFHAPESPTDVFKAPNLVKVPPQPPPPVPPAAGAAAANPQLEPQSVTVPTVTPPSVISSFNNNFKVDTSKMLDQVQSHLSVAAPQGTGLSKGGGGLSRGAGTSSVFGSSSAAAGQLEGYFYDLKQTSGRQPSGMWNDQYRDVLVKLVEQNWDESVLAPYYKCPDPLYTSAIFIPNMSSDLGPKAFGVDKEVQPTLWIVWYKGKVKVPIGGKYCFAGLGDDVLLVRLGKNNVFDGGLCNVFKDVSQTPWTYPSGTIYNYLRKGADFTVSEDETMDIDIIIGERPGGNFNASLFLLKSGQDYPRAPDGIPILPLFRVSSDFTMPHGDFPSVSLHGGLWPGIAR